MSSLRIQATPPKKGLPKGSRRGKNGRIRKALATSIGAISIGAMAVHAQTEGLVSRSQVVRSGEGAQACPVLLVSFNHDLILSSQASAEGGLLLTVRLTANAAASAGSLLEDHIETEPSLNIPGLGSAFVTMTVSGTQPVMNIRFSNPAAGALATQAGARSMVISMFAAGDVCADTPEAPQDTSPLADGQADLAGGDVETEATSLLADARQSIVEKNFDHGIQLLTKLLELPRNSKSADAQELLGIARERNGQMAHAKAEYEIYLKTYPDADGVERVRQRLTSIETAEGMPPPDLRQAGPGRIFKALGFGKNRGKVSMTSIPRRNESFPPLRPQPGVTSRGSRNGDVLPDGTIARGDAGERAAEDPFRASFSAYYYTNQATTWITELESHKKDTDTDVLQNALVLSFDISDEFQRNGDTYSYRFSGEYQKDFTDAGKSRLNLSRVYGELNFGEGSPTLSVGRQSWNDDATLGRYDGIRVRYPISDAVRVNAVAGLSVNKKSDPMFGGDMKVIGLSADLLNLGKKNELSAYLVTEFGDGFTERFAIGIEGGFSNDANSVNGLIEFDQSLGALNIARLNWNHIFKDRSSLSVTADYDHSPSLGLSSALNGQTATTLAELSDIYSLSQIKELAKDRSAATLSFSVAWQKSLSDKWQLSLDGSAYNTGSTPASGGVAAVASTGWDYQLAGQIVGTSVFATDDVLSLSGRVANDATSDLTLLDGYWRYNVSDRLKLKPRLKVAHRNFANGSGKEDFAIPSVTLDYKVNDSSDLELELGSRLSTRDTPGFAEEANETYFVAGFSKQF